MSEREHSEPEPGRRKDPAGLSPEENAPAASADTVERARERGPSDANVRDSRTAGRGKRILKWAAFVVGLLFFLAVLREAMDPFGDKSYIEISHGDHVHYVPEDRDPNVPMSRFPTTEPAADERITPDGRIVKK